MTLRGYSTADLLKLYQESQAKCTFAGYYIFLFYLNYEINLKLNLN